MKRPCKGLVSVALLLLWTNSVKAQEAAQDAAHRHHPPQDQALHEKFYSTWHMPDNPTLSCCNNADCYPTEIQYVDGKIYARRREDGKYILIPSQKIERNRDNPDGRNHLCAPPPALSRLIRSIASHWEAPHEVHPGEWQNSRPDTFCLQCCETISVSYLREIGTQLPYCSYQCYARQRNLVAREQDRAREAS